MNIRSTMKDIKIEHNLTIFLVCFITTVSIQNVRSHQYELAEALSLFLGIAPSFLYVIGVISLIPLLKKKISSRQFIEYSSFFTLGACIYEFSQIWTKSHFDVLDIVATIAAYILSLYFHLSRTSSIENTKFNI